MQGTFLPTAVRIDCKIYYIRSARKVQAVFVNMHKNFIFASRNYSILRAAETRDFVRTLCKTAAAKIGGLLAFL